MPRKQIYLAIGWKLVIDTVLSDSKGLLEEIEMFLNGFIACLTSWREGKKDFYSSNCISNLNLGV